MDKIITDRLTLRAIKPKDIYGYSAIYGDNETMSMFGGTVASSDLDFRDIVLNIKTNVKNGHLKFWAITYSDEREFIGFVRLLSYESFYFDKSFESMGNVKDSIEFSRYVNRNNGWELDYALLKEYRNKGVMSESIEAIIRSCIDEDCTNIYAKINRLENIASIDLLPCETRFFLNRIHFTLDFEVS